MIADERRVSKYQATRRMAALALAAFMLLASPELARAEPTPAAKALAEALFQEGRSLARQQRWEDACPKFAASQEQDPASGTLLLLGECNEHLAKSLSAWVAYDEAFRLAKQAGNAARALKAHQRKAALEPTLSKLTLVVSPEALGVAGLEVKCDSVKVDPAAYGVPMPMDPGVIRVNVSAPGHKAATFEVTLDPSGDRKTMVIPLLEVEPTRMEEPGLAPVHEPVPRPVTSPIEPSNREMGIRRVLGAVFASSGLAVVGMSMGLGTHALALSREASSLCPGGACSGDSLYRRYADKVEDSRDYGLAAEVLVASGAVLTGATAVVLLWPSSDAAPGSSPTVSRLLPFVTLRKDEPVLGLRGAF